MKSRCIILFVLLLSPFMMAQRYVGGDISLLPEYEAHNSAYKTTSGTTIPDLLTWCVSECDWNLFRVRLFYNPTNPNHDGVVQTLDYVTKLGQRIKASGAKFMLDIHYSDTWVDAAHIQPPAAWKGLSDSIMADSVGAYTRCVLQHLKDSNATPDFIQVGNEIMFGLCGIQVHPYNVKGDNWQGYLGLLQAGTEAVRALCPEAKIIIHSDRPCEVANTQYYYQKLVDNQIDFDVIGLSFYPFWHGYMTAAQSTTANLAATLGMLASSFADKQVQIVETAYNFQYWPTSGVKYNTQSTWPCSKAGQYQMISDLMDLLDQYPQVNGLSYWCPEEAGNGDDTDWKKQSYGTVLATWLNRGFFDCAQSQEGHKIHSANSSDIAHLLGRFATSPSRLFSLVSTTIAHKYLYDTQILISHDGATYTLAGTCY